MDGQRKLETVDGGAPDEHGVAVGREKSVFQRVSSHDGDQLSWIVLAISVNDQEYQKYIPISCSRSRLISNGEVTGYSSSG